MIELLLPCGFNSLEYSWLKVTIGIRTLAQYYVAKKCQQPLIPEVYVEIYLRLSNGSCSAFRCVNHQCTNFHAWVAPVRFA
jgi:hypothetical protein